MDDRRFIKVLTRTRECPLSLNAWMVYSLLLSYEKPVAYSTARVKRDLGLSEPGAYAARDQLHDAKLLGDDGRPRPAPDDWFHKRHPEGLAYWKMYLPADACQMRLNEVAGYCYMRSLGKVIGASGLSTALGIARNTASKVTKELMGMGLISETKVIDTPPADWFRPRVKSRRWSELDAATKAVKTITFLQTPEWEQWANQQVEYDNDNDKGERKTFDLRRVVVRDMGEFARSAYEVGWSRLNVLDILGRILRVNARWAMWKPADVILDRFAIPLLNTTHAPIRDPGFAEMTDAKQKVARITAWREFSAGWNRAMSKLQMKMKDMVATGWYDWGV